MDREHGQQFKAETITTTQPNTAEGIEKYLGSGMVRGIGPAFAKRLVDAFGEKVFDVIEQEPARLREVAGIGPVRQDRLLSAWAEQKMVREIMVFLHSHGVGTSRAFRIYKTYGDQAIQMVTAYSDDSGQVIRRKAPSHSEGLRPPNPSEGARGFRANRTTYSEGWRPLIGA